MRPGAPLTGWPLKREVRWFCKRRSMARRSCWRRAPRARTFAAARRRAALARRGSGSQIFTDEPLDLEGTQLTLARRINVAIPTRPQRAPVVRDLSITARLPGRLQLDHGFPLAV
jgi:hypothetical protein